jgi:hypothetical protein
MFIIELSNALDVQQAGGKASQLAQALQWGYPVPAGLVLRRAALICFLEHNLLETRIQSLLDDYSQFDWSEQTKQFEKLVREIETFPVPQEVLTEVNPEILGFLKQSPDGLAVRSSSVCEDLKAASFAGVYESYLGINTLEAFWQSVLRCWCSAWSPRAVAYAHKIGMGLPVNGMAVLVQKLIPATSSGVIFTANPAAGNPWEFVLNATPGLAAPLVEGSAPADRYILEWHSGKLLERHIPPKPSALVVEDGHVVEKHLLPQEPPEPTLSDAQIQAVAGMALALDRAFDQRLDIEWAMQDEQLWLIQARPLTSLPDFFPAALSTEEAQETWFLQPPIFAVKPNERLFAPLVQNRLPLEKWNRYLTPADIFPRHVAMERIIHGYYYSTENKWGGNPQGYDLAGVERWLDVNETRLRQDWLAHLGSAQEWNTWLDHGIEKARSAVDLVKLFLEYEPRQDEMQAVGWYAVQWLIFNCDELMRGFIAKVMPDSGMEDLPSSLLQGLSCFSVERTAAAQALGRSQDEEFVRIAFAEQPLPQVIPFIQSNYPECRFLRDFSTFCRTYGLLLPVSEDKHPYVSDVEGVLLMVKNSLLKTPAGMRDVKDVLQKGARKRYAAEAQVRLYLSKNRPDQLERFNKLLDWSQFWTPALDNRKWHAAMTLRQSDLARRIKAALLDEKLIDHPEDFLLLTQLEWADYVKDPDPNVLRQDVYGAQLRYERNRRLEPAPYLGKPPHEAESSQAPQDSTTGPEQLKPVDLSGNKTIIQGTGVAPGKVRGIAYKVDDMETMNYAQGLTEEHILLCGPEQFPAQWRRDWYSLFMVVRGLVMVQGPDLHHAGQIARECGIPFINLPDTRFEDLPDRVEIEIDGRTGTMTIYK